MQKVEYILRGAEITRFGLEYWHPVFLVMCSWTGHLIAPESRVFSKMKKINLSLARTKQYHLQTGRMARADAGRGCWSRPSHLLSSFL